MTKAIFFDLFYTLIDPKYNDNTEYNVIGISESEWEKYAENHDLYLERAIGNVRSEIEIINKICDIMPYSLSELNKLEILIRRENRIKHALLMVDDKILDTLKKIRRKGIKIGLISNADCIDIKHWEESPLAELFDDVIFSCNVGMLKPNLDIYRLAMDNLQVTPEECIFVGDGSSDELYGAKSAGMTTIFSLYLESKPIDQLKKIVKYVDYYINSFLEVISLLDYETILTFKTDISEVIYSPCCTEIKEQINGNELTIILEEPPDYAQEMMAAISNFLKTKQNVNSAYLRLATCEDTQYYFIVIDFFGELIDLYTDISQVAIPLSNGLFFEYHQLSSEFALYAIENVKPFYTNYTKIG